MFDLFANLGATGARNFVNLYMLYYIYFLAFSQLRNIFCFATEEQLDFPVLYASAKEGWASSTFTKKPPDDEKNMLQLLDAIIRHVPPPSANLDAPFKMLVRG